MATATHRLFLYNGIVLLQRLYCNSKVKSPLSVYVFMDLNFEGCKSLRYMRSAKKNCRQTQHRKTRKKNFSASCICKGSPPSPSLPSISKALLSKLSGIVDSGEKTIRPSLGLSLAGLGGLSHVYYVVTVGPTAMFVLRVKSRSSLPSDVGNQRLNSGAK